MNLLRYANQIPRFTFISDADKQDCERNAFKRLAKRLKAEFKRLPIMVMLDGLYPNGPVLEKGILYGKVNQKDKAR